MGLPGSGKTTLASKLVPLLNAKWLNNDEARKAANDWDFSEEGRLRQAKRMADIAEKYRKEGRYDYLVEKVGGDHTSACGFAIGVERIILLLESLNLKNNINLPDVYVVNLGDNAEPFAFKIAEKLRNEDLKVSFNLDKSSFKSQMKKADKSQAKVALIIGDEEVKNKKIQVKLIRDGGIQESVDNDNILSYIKEKINFGK